MNKLFTLAGLLLATVLAFIAFKLQTAGWIILSVLALFLSLWQGKRLRAQLSQQHTPQLKPSNIKYWGLRLTAFALISLFTIASYGYYLGQSHNLPKNYQWQALLWSVGFTPTPTLLDIPAGQFEMGDEIAKPIHTVTIPQAFKMSQHEITFAQYDYYIWQMKQQGFKQLEYPKDEKWGRDSLPVINVNWDDAQGYINWFSQNNKQGLQCRLPSEAEWEYAARAGSTTKYYWGNKPNRDYANYGKEKCCDGVAEGNDKWVNTAPVGSFKANNWGLQDMSGNVYEWTQDCYESYEKTPKDGTSWEGGKCADRVVRGGSWNFTSNFVRSADRDGNTRDYRDYNLGFRVICSFPLIPD